VKTINPMTVKVFYRDGQGGMGFAEAEGELRIWIWVFGGTIQ